MLFRSTTTKFLLALTLIPFVPGCEEDDGGDDSGDTAGDDGGPADGDGGDGSPSDGGGDGGSADGGSADGGSADGGPADGGDSSPADSGNPGDGGDGGGSDVGDTCTDNSECNDVCVFAGDADFGICTTRCESFADCPDFWDCGPVGNASGDYCVPG